MEIYKYTDVQSGDVEYSADPDKYTEACFFDRMNKQRIKVLDAEDFEQPQPTAASIYEAIKHGDARHRQWLRQALENIFAGQPVPHEDVPHPAQQQEPDVIGCKCSEYAPLPATLEEALREIKSWRQINRDHIAARAQLEREWVALRDAPAEQQAQQEPVAQLGDGVFWVVAPAEIKAARKKLEDKWDAEGHCRSCGWHAALYEHDVTDSDIAEALGSFGGILQLGCRSKDDDDNDLHRGVIVNLRD